MTKTHDEINLSSQNESCGWQKVEQSEGLWRPHTWNSCSHSCKAQVTMWKPANNKSFINVFWAAWLESAQDHRPHPHPVPERHPAPRGLLIGCFTGIYPITVHINWLWQIGNGRLELLQADCAWYNPSISAPLHFDITWLLVVAEGTGELRVQISRHLLLRRGLSLGLAATHCTQTEPSLWV